MGNRGFAITSLLYGLFVVFLVIFWSFMSAIRTGNKQRIKFYEEVASSLERDQFCDWGVVLDSSNSSSLELERGKYLVSVSYQNGSSCEEEIIFLPDRTSFLFKNGNLMILSGVGAFDEQKVLMRNCQNSRINDVTILGYWCTEDKNEGT